MMFVVYGVIIFLASGIGAFLGGGSGVIIKPLLRRHHRGHQLYLLRVRFCHELQFHREAPTCQDEGGL